ncbi:MAG: hexose kinase [Ornithinibacter sp.]
MILCITPNPAWDVTYRLPALIPDAVHHVCDVAERAGGKGVNVASVARGAGHDVLVCAPVGGARRAEFMHDLTSRGLSTALINSPLPTRQSVAVVTPHGVTMLNEQGVPQPDAVWLDLISTVEREAGRCRVVTVSGSLPPQTPADLLARITRAAHQGGARVVLDCRGPHLLKALREGPELVKPNAEEAQATTGESDPVRAARALVAAGARAALVTLGAEGVVVVDDRGTALRARLDSPVSGNPTGAGDAMTAAVAVALERTEHPDWRATLRDGVSWSAAAVLADVAGEVDHATVADLIPHVLLEEIR